MKPIYKILLFACLMLIGNSVFASDVDSLIQQAPAQWGGKGLFALRMGYLGMCLFGAFWLAFTAFNVWKWDFVSKCLSETKHGVTSPSGFRLIGYISTVAVLYAFTYHCVRKQVLDTTQLGYVLLYAAVVLGIVKSTEIAGIFSRQAPPPQPKDEPKPDA